jgi:hypothetical protein
MSDKMYIRTNRRGHVTIYRSVPAEIEGLTKRTNVNHHGYEVTEFVSKDGDVIDTYLESFVYD